MKVFFFGGYKSDFGDVGLWQMSLKVKFPNIDVYAYAYPLGASAGNPLAVWHDSEKVATLVDDNSIIVGHSSGCAIANDVAWHAAHMKTPWSPQFKLIALDGFRPCQALLNLPKTEVWSAKAGPHYSLNYHSLSDCVNFHVYEANSNQTELWPLHFSLVNLNASNDYDKISDGYHKCMANHIVLGLEEQNV